MSELAENLSESNAANQEKVTLTTRIAMGAFALGWFSAAGTAMFEVGHGAAVLLPTLPHP